MKNKEMYTPGTDGKINRHAICAKCGKCGHDSTKCPSR